MANPCVFLGYIHGVFVSTIVFAAHFSLTITQKTHLTKRKAVTSTFSLSILVIITIKKFWFSSRTTCCLVNWADELFSHSHFNVSPIIIFSGYKHSSAACVGDSCMHTRWEDCMLKTRKTEARSSQIHSTALHMDFIFNSILNRSLSSWQFLKAQSNFKFKTVTKQLFMITHD